jgi:hypothetical protein
MPDADNEKLLDQIEAEAVRVGGGAKRGIISKKELEEAEEIRVSIRPPMFMGSTELFTLRNLKPGDYHLILVAVPRKNKNG